MDKFMNEKYNSSMAQYAIAFDLDTKGMFESGMTKSMVTKIYQSEIPEALKKCGFTVRPQGSLYHTHVKEDDAISSIMTLQTIVKTLAPEFCKWVRKVHVFRMDEWSDVTNLISTRDMNHDQTKKKVNITVDDILKDLLGEN